MAGGHGADSSRVRAWPILRSLQASCVSCPGRLRSRVGQRPAPARQDGREVLSELRPRVHSWSDDPAARRHPQGRGTHQGRRATVGGRWAALPAAVSACSVIFFFAQRRGECSSKKNKETKRKKNLVSDLLFDVGAGCSRRPFNRGRQVAERRRWHLTTVATGAVLAAAIGSAAPRRHTDSPSPPGPPLSLLPSRRCWWSTSVRHYSECLANQRGVRRRGLTASVET